METPDAKTDEKPNNNPLAPFWYTPSGHKDDGLRVKLRALTPFEYYDVQAAVVLVDGSTRMTGASARTALRAGLLEWEGVHNAEGNPLALTRDLDAATAQLGLVATNDIISKIIDATQLRELQRKN